MQVIVVLRPEAVPAAAETADSDALLESLAEQLQRPSAEMRKQAASSRFISVEVADARAAQDTIERVTQLPAVETAYMKPADELP